MGSACDFTAIAVVERAEMVGEWDGAAFAHRRAVEMRLRHLERLPLGLKYPEIERRVKRMLESGALGERWQLVVDATGVGRPVVDHLRESGFGWGQMKAVMVTGGQVERSEGGFEYVPKRDLIVGLQLMLEDESLKITTELQHVEALRKEMGDMRVKITAAGNEQFGAWRSGEHDDLVFAVALACWGAGKAFPGRLRGNDGWWEGRRPCLMWW